METLLARWSIRKKNYDVLAKRKALINKITEQYSAEYEAFVKKRILSASKIAVYNEYIYSILGFIPWLER